MCVLRNHKGKLAEPLTDEEFRAIEDWLKIRTDQMENEPRRGLIGLGSGEGWACPNCGSAHAPSVATCPEPPRGAGLREGLGNGSTLR